MNYKDQIKFNCGKTLKYRIVQAPMVTKGANLDGSISEENLAYYGARSKVAGAVIVEACYVHETGKGFMRQIGAQNDDQIAGLTELAQAIKKDGALAIMQIYHEGREAITAYQKNGRAVAPSAIDFDFLDYPVEELTQDEILEIVKAYGQAARRAYEAGFDGVEIHGANHYLIQQFFSAFSNLREDEWGGTLEKRMAFPLAVTSEVKRVVSTFYQPEFIVGYRISPEEVHGETVGYDYKESLELVKQLVEHDLDYLHISNFGIYDMGPNALEASYAEIFKEEVGAKVPVITVASVFNETDVEGALAIADIVAIGRAALLDPQFTDKLVNDRADEINHEMSPEVTDYVKWPAGVYDWYRQGVPLPPVPNIESVL